MSWSAFWELMLYGFGVNMAACERNHSLKEALCNNLTAILSPDHKLRLAAEEQLKALELTEGIICCSMQFYAKLFSYISDNKEYELQIMKIAPS